MRHPERLVFILFAVHQPRKSGYIGANFRETFSVARCRAMHRPPDKRNAATDIETRFFMFYTVHHYCKAFASVLHGKKNLSDQTEIDQTV